MGFHSHFLAILTLTMTIGLGTGCSGSEFSGNPKTPSAGPQGARATPPPQTANATPSANTPDPLRTTAVPSDCTASDKTSCEAQPGLKTGIAKCLQIWASNGSKPPFTESSPHRTIAASVTVFGAGNAINDETATNAPELVVIIAGVNVLSTPRYRLLNPNGWYCMIADVNVLSNLTVDLHKTARLADSRVNVGVLSSSNGQTANVDVNVLASVTKNRVER
ncbi:MAG: hypothetical protein FJ146_08390 [Deltaproteobacteria bacterium]|nr:hypothetical protein [Deltaproteobacteria bacterium]